MKNTLRNLKTYQMADEMMAIFRIAVRKAQEESRRLGVPNVYSINGHLYYELPNGDYIRQPKKSLKDSSKDNQGAPNSS